MKKAYVQDQKRGHCFIKWLVTLGGYISLQAKGFSDVMESQSSLYWEAEDVWQMCQLSMTT